MLFVGTVALRLAPKWRWIPLRALSQFLFILIAEFLTVFVLIETRPLLDAGALLGAFYICG
jgi:hypothetical protein